MKVVLLRRWGSSQPGTSVEVDAVQARWLVDNAYGTAAGITAPDQGSVAPGTDGPDPLASVAARPRPVTRRGPYKTNRALPVEGSPVQYNAGVAERQEGPEAVTSEPSSKPGAGRKKSPARG